MASNLMHHKVRIEDRISGMPDAVLCHILSFLFTTEAVKTSVLSHRWKNVWASVPVLDLDEEEYDADMNQPLYNPEDCFAQFVNRVLMFRCSGDIHRFRLSTNGMDDVSLIYAWISTAIRRNVVEFDLTVQRSTVPPFEIPKSLFMCSTLVRFKLWLHRGIRVMIPTSSNCFPSLKFLHVTVHFPDSDSMEKLFSRLPVLEELIIDGNFVESTTSNLDISAPKLKRLQTELRVFKHDMHFANFVNYVCQIFVNVDAPNLEELDICFKHDMHFANFVNYVCQIFVNVDAPNLEELDICFDPLVSFSLKNAKCLRKAKIDFFYVEELKKHDYFLGLADRIHQIFAGIYDAKYLTVKAPLLAALDIGHQYLLPTFNNLNYLELQLHTCRCLQSLATVLKISPHLEQLKILLNRKHMYANENNYSDDVDEDEVEPEWDAPETVPVCLISHLKTICLWDFKGCPDDMEVAKYLVQHGKALNRVTIHTPFCENKEMKSQSATALWSNVSKFPRGSKTCEIEFQTII